MPTHAVDELRTVGRRLHHVGNRTADRSRPLSDNAFRLLKVATKRRVTDLPTDLGGLDRRADLVSVGIGCRVDDPVEGPTLPLRFDLLGRHTETRKQQIHLPDGLESVPPEHVLHSGRDLLLDVPRINVDS